METSKHIRAVLLLPFMATIVIPALLLYFGGTDTLGFGEIAPATRIILPVIGAAMIVLVYMPLVEEPGLAKRFGEEYEEYCRNVPRWIPKVRGWEPGPE